MPLPTSAAEDEVFDDHPTQARVHNIATLREDYIGSCMPHPVEVDIPNDWFNTTFTDKDGNECQYDPTKPHCRDVMKKKFAIAKSAHAKWTNLETKMVDIDTKFDDLNLAGLVMCGTTL